MIDFIIGALLGLAVGAVCVYLVRKKKKGGSCTGCSGCSGCGASCPKKPKN